MTQKVPLSLTCRTLVLARLLFVYGPLLLVAASAADVSLYSLRVLFFALRGVMTSLDSLRT